MKTAPRTKRRASASPRKAAQRKPAPQTPARKAAATTAPVVKPELVIQGAGRTGPRISDSLKALAAATAKHPGKLAGGLRRAGAELVKVAGGRSNVTPAANDRRFEDSTWRDNALYRRLMQGHLTLARETHRLAG